MTTVGDTIKAALDANWSGAGGTEPILYNTEDIGQSWPPDDDYIMILGWTFKEREKARNDAFKGVKQYIDMRVHSKNDANGEERLDTIVTEIKRIIKPANVTGYHHVRVIDQHRRASDKRNNIFIAVLTVELLVISTSSAVTPGSGGDGDVAFPADVSVAGDATIAGTLGVTGDATVANLITAGNVDGVDVSTHKASLADHTDLTATAAQIEDLLMFGSANKTHVGCILWGENAPGKMYVYGSYISNVDATNFYVGFQLPLPSVKGTLGLHIDELKIGIKDADATNFVTLAEIYGWTDHDSATQIFTDATDYTAAATVTYSVGDTDCSGYKTIMVKVEFVCADAAALDISFATLQCWYE